MGSFRVGGGASSNLGGVPALEKRGQDERAGCPVERQLAEPCRQPCASRAPVALPCLNLPFVWRLLPLTACCACKGALKGDVTNPPAFVCTIRDAHTCVVQIVRSVGAPLVVCTCSTMVHYCHTLRCGPHPVQGLLHVQQLAQKPLGKAD